MWVSEWNTILHFICILGLKKKEDDELIQNFMKLEPPKAVCQRGMFQFYKEN